MNEPQMHATLYWRVWGFLVAGLVIVRIFLYLNRPTPEGELFALFGLYAGPTWVSVIALNFIEGHRIRKYLEQYHNDKFIEISTIGTGPGFYNGFSALRFARSRDDLGDTNLRLLKLNYLKCLRLFITVFVSFIPLFLFIMLIDKVR